MNRKTITSMAGVIALIGALIALLFPATANADASYRRLTILDGSLNDIAFFAANPDLAPGIRVFPGETITGTFTVRYEHDYPESHVYPLAIVPSWGDRTTTYWQAASDMVDGGTYEVTVTLTAPDEPGEYNLIVATHAEYNAAQVASATHWSWHGDPIWYDGNDLYDWSDETIAAANAEGHVVVPYGSNTGVADVAACAVRIRVDERYRRLTLLAGDANGTELDPTNPTVIVAPGGSLSGSLEVQFGTSYPSSHVFPLAATPTWGDREEVYWQIHGDMHNGNSYLCNYDLAAPQAPGIYHLILATASEYNAAQIVSGTHWSSHGTPIWGNGDDLYDWTPAIIQRAQSEGSINVAYYNGLGADNLGAAALQIVVEDTDLPERSLTFTDIRLNGFSMPAYAMDTPSLRVEPGQPIIGSFSSLFEHNSQESVVFPLAVVWTWGDRTESFAQAASDMVNGGTYSGELDLVAPLEEGDYYIIIATHPEYNAAQIASATHWSYNWDPIWNNGDDLFDWSPETLAEVMANGSALVPYGSNAGQSVVAARAIRVAVRSQSRRLTLVDASVNGRELPESAELRVAPGAPISGLATLHYWTDYPVSHVMPLVVTPTWGDKQSVYWLAEQDMQSGGEYDVDFDLMAPDEPGTYYLLFLNHSEYTAEQVASNTHWSASYDGLWNNGDDAYDWPADMIEEARKDGTLIAPCFDMGIGASYGVAAIRVVVDEATDVGPSPGGQAMRVSNSPNPFNPITTVAYTMVSGGHVKVQIFDARGRLVRTLVDETVVAGDHAVIWNGRDDSGRNMASGVYYCRVHSRDGRAQSKMLLVK